MFRDFVAAVRDTGMRIERELQRSKMALPILFNLLSLLICQFLLIDPAGNKPQALRAKLLESFKSNGRCLNDTLPNEPDWGNSSGFP